MKKRKACVLGAGNSAHVAAGLIAGLPDWECSMLAVWENEAERLQEGIDRGGIRLYYGADDDNKVIHGVPVKVSRDPEEVVPGCELLLLCLPALAYDVNIRAAAPFVAEGAMLGTICGSNGFDWCMDEAMSNVGRASDSYGVFALQNLPWACR